VNPDGRTGQRADPGSLERVSQNERNRKAMRPAVSENQCPALLAAPPFLPVRL